MQNVHGWEKALIGSVMYEPNKMEDAIDLSPSDFSHTSHSMIWGVMMELYQADNLGMRTLVETLREKQILSSIVSPNGGDFTEEAYIQELLQSRGQQTDLYTEKIIDAAGRRKLLHVGGIISSLAQDENLTFQQALDEAEEKVLGVRRNRSSELGVTLQDLLSVYVPRLERMRNGEIVPGYTPSIQNLKDVIEYAEDDEYIVIAARPGDGKSSILRHEAYHKATEGDGVLIFNLENSHMEYARAMLSLHTGLDNTLLKRPERLSEEQLNIVRQGHAELNELPIHIVSLGAPSVDEIKRIARAKIAKYDIDIIMVDYVQLIRNNNFNNRNNDITYSSGALRGLSLNYKIPVIAAAQLNRSIERRGANAEPILADLRDSGSLEQDATQVWFSRKLWAEPTEAELGRFAANRDEDGEIMARPPALPMRIYVKKNRNGPTGITQPILWDRSNGDFMSLEVSSFDY